jgi:hypothetical protein
MLMEFRQHEKVPAPYGRRNRKHLTMLLLVRSKGACTAEAKHKCNEDARSLGQ